MNRIFLPLLLVALLSCNPARAGYRVALLIGEDTAGAEASLEQHAFRCEGSDNLPDKELRRLIEDWASRTPTNSTALLYFEGELQVDQQDGVPAVCLVAANQRLVPIQMALNAMSSRGGSQRNLLVISSPTRPEFKEELPPNCLVSFGRIPPAESIDLIAKLRPTAKASTLSVHDNLMGKGWPIISRPDQFLPGKEAGDVWINARGMVFCWCPPGKFTAGSLEGTPGRHADEEQREVVIKDGFWIGKYELTRSQNLRNNGNRSIGTEKNHPVEMLHWDDGRSMLRRFTEEEREAKRLPAGWEYTLPTEDQWEYAARAGTTTRYYFGDKMNGLPQYANFADKSYYDSGDIYSNAAHRTLDDGFAKLAPVGSFRPNPWGLHDVYGNVTEWCRDHGARGGGWVSVGENCRSAYRDTYSSRNEQNYLGYRLIIQPNAPDGGK